MNLTPKKDFLEKKTMAEVHRNLVVSTPFREALNAALIDHILSLPSNADPIASYNQIVGARDFVKHLLNIAEMSKTPPAPLPTNLDHGVK